jgi:hypothetical protein
METNKSFIAIAVLRIKLGKKQDQFAKRDHQANNASAQTKLTLLQRHGTGIATVTIHNSKVSILLT